MNRHRLRRVCVGVTISAAAAAAAAACAATGCGPGAGHYERPDVPRLAADAPIGSHTNIREDAAATVARWGDTPTSKALWAAVAHAEADGLEEMYGFESFDGGGVDYDASFVLRTKQGRLAVMARQDWAGGREDETTVPSVPVTEEAFRRLRDRAGLSLPFPHRADLASRASDGYFMLIHVFRDGRSEAALWYEPVTDGGPEREAMEQYDHAFEVVSVIDAIRAAMPLDFFPDKDHSYRDTYGKLPGY